MHVSLHKLCGQFCLPIFQVLTVVPFILLRDSNVEVNIIFLIFAFFTYYCLLLLLLLFLLLLSIGCWCT